jgi:SNF2 family DNA or RNA helicase
VLTTYPQLIRDVDELRGFAFERLVLDEAQQIKNAATAQARAARQLTARHRVALTGTPVENRLGDLWSIMRVVSPELLGSAASFRARYAVPIERYGDADAAARLRRRIRPVVLRRVKTDPAVLRDLPAKVELRQLCTLTTEQAALYRAVVDDMMERLRDRSSQVRRSGVVLAAMTRLKQVCNHPAHLLGDSSALPGRSGKLARLEELLAQVIAGGERALCFTQFARFGAMLAPYLSARLGIEVQFLHGGLRPAERDALVARFQAGRGPGVFLLSLKAGGTGVNLTAANHVVHIDRWWNPAVEAQATDRAYRIGQPRDVWVRTLLCMGTLEERIDRILVDKAALARTVISGGESWLAALSNDELRDLVALAPEAVRD